LTPRHASTAVEGGGVTKKKNGAQPTGGEGETKTCDLRFATARRGENSAAGSLGGQRGGDCSKKGTVGVTGVPKKEKKSKLGKNATKSVVW